MEHSNSAVEHLDGTVYSRQVSSHYKKADKLINSVHIAEAETENANHIFQSWLEGTSGLTLGSSGTSIRWFKMCNMINRYPFSLYCLDQLKITYMKIIIATKQAFTAYLYSVAWAYKNELWNPINDVHFLSRHGYPRSEKKQLAEVLEQ